SLCLSVLLFLLFLARPPGSPLFPYTTLFRSRGVARPDYICQRQFIDRDAPRCQTIPGAGIDAAVGDLLLATLTPMALEVALTVEEELHNRAEEADRLRRQHVERARYEADLARRRYMAVDPTTRLVADALEAEW